MRRFGSRIVVVISLFFLYQFGDAQCPDFDIIFGATGIELINQNDIDSFRILYPECDSMPGTIFIADPLYSINNLEGLSNLRYVHEIRISSAPILPNFKGLEQLVEIDILSINRCYKLENLDHISNLNINEILRIDFVDNLSSIVGMEQVDSLQLLAIDNTGLDTLSIDGLRYLTFVKELSLGGKLSGTGLSNLLRVDELLASDGFNDMSQLFELIPNVDMSFDLISISGPDTFEMDGIENLESVNHLRLTRIQQLDLGGLESLDISPIYQIEVKDCEDVLNLNAISNLKIEYIFNLTNIGGITEIPHFNNYNGPQRLACRGLPELVDISSMETWENLEGVFISVNPNLAVCHNKRLCELIADSASLVFIQDNAPGCTSVDEVLEQCITDVKDKEVFNEVAIYPNPVVDEINLSGLDHEVGAFQYRIFDVIGNCQSRGVVQAASISVASLPSGYYILQLEKEGYVRSFTFVKE